MPYHLISSDVAKAATVGDVGAVRYYLERNPERVNAPSIFQSKLLHIASKAGHASVVQLLIELGADVKALDYGGMRRTALHWACLYGNVRVVELLVDAGADPKASGIGWQELVKQRACGKHVDTDSPPPEPPTSICADSHCWLALLRAEWTPELNAKFPPRFKGAVRLLLLASRCSRDTEEGPTSKLTADVCQEIIVRMAYPISAWV